jgi:hypothetical protein
MFVCPEAKGWRRVFKHAYVHAESPWCDEVLRERLEHTHWRAVKPKLSKEIMAVTHHIKELSE